MSNVKLVLFDIGGVLIEYGNVFTTLEKEQHIPVDTMYGTFDKYDTEITKGKITPQELYKKSITENNLRADPNYNFTDSWIKDYISIKPTYNLVPLVKQKYKVGLFSNIYKNMVPEMIKRELLPSIDYDYKFISCDIGMQKPDPETYEFIEKTTQLKGSEILFIDDRDDYLQPAKDLGWQTLKFQRYNPEDSISLIKKMLMLD